MTDEGAPADAANGYSPLIRHFVPPSPDRGKASVETGSGMVEGSILALSVFAAQIHLSQRERHWQYGKVLGFAKGSPFGGAVTAGD